LTQEQNRRNRRRLDVTIDHSIKVGKTAEPSVEMTQMNTGEYMLEIFQPNSSKDLWVSFESSTPFLEIHVGDLINPHVWPGSKSPQKILRVLNIEHIIWENKGKVKHKICVYSEEVDGSIDRLSGKQ
jgi:hypothetical protein